MIPQLGMPWHLPASTASALHQQALRHQIYLKNCYTKLKFMYVQKSPIEIDRSFPAESFGIRFFSPQIGLLNEFGCSSFML